MSTSESLLVLVHEPWIRAVLPGSAAADPSCNVSEVSRLLWTSVVVAAAAAAVTVVRPSWRRVAGSVGAALTWAWIDMEGPVLVSWATHGLHLADVPVVIALTAAGAAALRIVLKGRRLPR